MKTEGTITKRFVAWLDLSGPGYGDFLGSDEIFLKTNDGEFTLTYDQFKGACRRYKRIEKNQ